MTFSCQPHWSSGSDELGRMWKEAVVRLSDVLFERLPRAVL